MPGDDHDLVRFLTSGPVGDHIVAVGIGQHRGSEQQFERDRALRGQPCHQVGIFRRQRAGRDRGLPVLEHRDAGVRQTIVRAAHRTDQRGACAQRCRLRCTRAAILHGTAIGLEGIAIVCQSLIEMLVEQHDAARHFAGAALELIEIVDDDDTRRKALGRRGRREPQRHYVQPLAEPGRSAGILNQFRLFGAAHPVRHLCRLQSHRCTKRAHRGGDLADGRIQLR